MQLHTTGAPAKKLPYSNDLTAMIRAEYHEMPGLRLTLSQAARLWNVDLNTCAHALESLTHAGFLYRSGDSFMIASGRPAS